MRVIIIEDEEAAYKSLTRMIHNIDNNIKIENWLRSVKKAIDWFETNEMPDLIFLDIQLTDGISFEIFETLEITSPVIFTTAYSEYAIKAFEINGVDYLLKPFNQEQLKKSVDKYLKYHSGMNPSKFSEIINLFKTGKTDNLYKSRFLVKTGDKLKTILTSEIAYFYRDELVSLVTKDNKKFLLDHTLDELAEMLNPKEFFRINRQFLIHIESIIQAHKYYKGKLKIKISPETDDELIISQERASKFKEWMDGKVK
jgi:two-component system, LytTR family, response regulator LytT